MDNKADMMLILRRIIALRTELVTEYPFYGRLLLHLTLAVAACGTACTDMEKIIFDPEFARKLSDEELKFVMLHEVMHCVLKHCVRGLTRDKDLYNIACDIVVNSLILESMGLKTFTIYGEEPIHLTPDDREGRDFTAEEVYDMFLKQGGGNMPQPGGNSTDDRGSGNRDGSGNGSSGGNGNNNSNSDSQDVDDNGSENAGTGSSGRVDNHDIWDNISDADSQRLTNVWDVRIHNASKNCGKGAGIPQSIKRYLDETNHMPRTNWKQMLSDFIRHDRADYTFQCRDARYSGDIIMPSFVDNMYGDNVSELWLCVDTSGSISDKMLGIIYAEILSASAQLDAFSGKMAFFDTELSDFFPFEDEEDINNIHPVGGGGTSFQCIFDRLAECKDDELPVGIVILTDGYALYPDEEVVLGVPVLWVIINSDVRPDWGTAVYVKE